MRPTWRKAHASVTPDCAEVDATAGEVDISRSFVPMAKLHGHS